MGKRILNEKIVKQEEINGIFLSLFEIPANEVNYKVGYYADWDKEKESRIDSNIIRLYGGKFKSRSSEMARYNILKKAIAEGKLIV